MLGASPERPPQRLQLLEALEGLVPTRNLLGHHLLFSLLKGARGLTIAPELAIGDGALGFWKALPQVWPSTRAQRCWCHKTANILNYLPKSVQPRAKDALHQVWMASTRGERTRAEIALRKLRHQLGALVGAVMTAPCTRCRVRRRLVLRSAR